MKKLLSILILSIISLSHIHSQTNLATNGANALASAEISGGEAAMAFDGDTATGWVVTSSTVQWIQYDLGAPLVCDGYAMHYLVDSSPSFQPISWTFEGSNNGTDWTSLDDVTDNSVFNEWEQFITSNTTAYQYYRLDITAAGGDTLAIGELQLYVIETPTVITGNANYIEAEMASCSGNVLQTGGAPVLQRGICYNTTGNPTLDHSYRMSSAGIGSYNTMLTNLMPNTTYYFRAFAINDMGTSYANVVRTFTTYKLDQTISFSSLADKTYGDTDFDPAASATSGLTVVYSSSNTSVATVVSNQIHLIGGGSTTITASQLGNLSYNAAPPVDQTLSVRKKELLVTADDSEKIYGEPNPLFSVSYSGFVNGEDEGNLTSEPTATCEATVLSDAGTYFITPADGTDNSYSFTYVPGYLTVHKAPLDIIVSDTEKLYGDKNPEFSWIYSGFVNNDDASDIDALPEALTSANSSSDVGMYDILLSGGGDNNYDFVVENGSLSILKASLSGSPDNQVKSYGQVNPELTYSFVGFKNDDDVSDLDTVPVVSTLATDISLVGTYPIQMNPYQDKNYSISYTDGTLSIEKAFLNATVDNVTRYEGVSNPDFEIVYTGFVNGDNAGDIDTPPSATCIADETSAPGNYAIEVSGGSDDNYDILTYNAILTIEEEPDAISNQSTFEISVYPNPVHEKLYLKGNTSGLKLYMMSITGSIVLEQNLESDYADVSSIPAGLYLLTLRNENEIVFQEKIIVD